MLYEGDIGAHIDVHLVLLMRIHLDDLGELSKAGCPATQEAFRDVLEA